MQTNKLQLLLLVRHSSLPDRFDFHIDKGKRYRKILDWGVWSRTSGPVPMVLFRRDDPRRILGPTRWQAQKRWGGQSAWSGIYLVMRDRSSNFSRFNIIFIVLYGSNNNNNINMCASAPLLSLFIPEHKSFFVPDGYLFSGHWLLSFKLNESCYWTTFSFPVSYLTLQLS